MTDEEARRARVAANESVFREANERIEGLHQTFAAATDDGVSIVCGGDTSCAERIELDLATYERVRTDPTLFIVGSGHAVPDVEDVVERHDHFDIVCKHRGAGRAVSRETDPRS